MIISVASGKGGTGKTTVATNFAVALADIYKTALLDCDVEEPNAHLFLNIDKRQYNLNEKVFLPVPQIDDKNVCTVANVLKYVHIMHWLI